MADPVTLDDIYALFQTSQAEADRRFAEADRRAAESKAESDRSLAELKRLVDNTTRAVDGLTTRWGQFVENLVEPAVLRLFQERGIDVQEVTRRMRSQRRGAEMEIDIFAVDGDVAVAVEVKSRLSHQDVEYFLGCLGRFKLSFPHYADYDIYGAVAGIEIDEGVDRFAYQRGLFVIKQTGDTVMIANNSTFQPTAW
ncbi:hypothetical protein [Phormidium tenue]|uniref:DUF3782 domain-containing protein n=1 Tax=Phormidium tenue NIES-30 TaxID=549789 RepID=A0A1U7J167_9CYAN|nr:hypothetical protein [Phormidium tenue]MBD2234053.1 hypothetical protein [Phormidium tenue FACHB-1052]OKH45441.1 hypothetical protein NIES30_19635 [Phormidium tenue NIES-30]